MYNPEINKMLTKAVNICREGGRYWVSDAFDTLVAYLGLKMKMHSEPLSISDKTQKELDALNMDLLLKDTNDHLGGLLTSLQINDGRRGQHLTPPTIAEFMVVVTDVKTLKPGQRIMDPACGTGVFLITASKYIQPGVELYGIDNDRRMCRTCITQLAMYTKNPFFILCDDALKQEHDWSKANKW